MPTSSVCPCSGCGKYPPECKCDYYNRLINAAAPPAEGTPEGVDEAALTHCKKCGHTWKWRTENGWHPCEDKLVELLSASRAEAAKLREDIGRYVWNLAGCLTIAESETPTKYSKELALPALDAVNTIVSKLSTALADAKHWRAVAEAKDRECGAKRERANKAVGDAVDGLKALGECLAESDRIRERLSIAEADRDALVPAAKEQLTTSDAPCSGEWISVFKMTRDQKDAARAVLDRLAAGAAPKGETS